MWILYELINQLVISRTRNTLWPKTYRGALEVDISDGSLEARHQARHERPGPAPGAAECDKIEAGEGKEHDEEDDDKGTEFGHHAPDDEEHGGEALSDAEVLKHLRVNGGERSLGGGERSSKR